MCNDPFVCDMTHSYATLLNDTWHDLFICDMTRWYLQRPIHMWHDSVICDMTHSNVTQLSHMLHDAFIRDMTHSFVTWLIHIWHDSICTWHSLAICDMWHVSSICDMSHQYVTQGMCEDTWRDLIMCAVTHSYVPWLIYMGHDIAICDMWYVSSICDTRYVRGYVMWLDHVCRDSFICAVTYLYVTRHSHMWHVTCLINMWRKVCARIRDVTWSYVPWLIHVCRDSFICDMTQ